jgi:transcriptional antiterminator NusG
MKWYVVHTYASHEFKIKEAIEKGKVDTELDDQIGRILIPTQKTYMIRDGKKIEREKKVFNSYIIVEANLTNAVSNFIRSMPAVTNFLGDGKKAVPLSENEVNRLLGISDRDGSNDKGYGFLPGDIVKINSGPFTDFEGVVKKVSDDNAKLTVEVTVFGRVTPVEVASDQVEINK